MQRKAIEGKVKAEADMANAESNMMLREAQAMKLIAEARSIASEEELKQMQMQLEDMISKRQSLTAIAVAGIKADSEEKKIDGQKQIANKRGAGT